MLQEKNYVHIVLIRRIVCKKAKFDNFFHANFMRVIERERKREYVNNLQITCKYLRQNSCFPRYYIDTDVIYNKTWNYILLFQIHQL